MTNGDNLDDLLARLRDASSKSASAGFMDEVWSRAGEMSARRDSRTSLALFASFIVIGLGAGATVTRAPLFAEPSPYVLSEEASLSPAALLHLNP